MKEKFPEVPLGQPKMPPQDKIKLVYNERTCANRAFQLPNGGPGPELTKSSMTAMDLFAFPEEIAESKEAFLAWFEPRFFPLREKKDFDRFAQGCRRAMEVIQAHPYLLSPKIGEDFSLSRNIVSRFSDRNGFQNIEHVLSVFKKVALPNTEKNARKFFSPDRRSNAGAERISVCRILSVAYALEITKQSQDLKKFFEYARFVLGQTDSNIEESGILSTLIVRGDKIKALEEPDGDFQFLEWLEKGQIFEKCNLNNIGDQRSFYIPEVYVGTKSGLRAFLKILRDPTAELEMLSDFFRLSFIFDDKMTNGEIVDLLSQLEKEADKKTKVITKIEFREKNYFSPEERDRFFSDKDGQIPLVRNMKKDKNPSSGKNFKNISAKVNLFHPGEEKAFFGFEIQFLRKTERENNERIGVDSDHFTFAVKQVSALLSRFNSKLDRREFIREIKEYLETVDTEKMPDKLSGKNWRTGGYFESDFSGSLREKAESIFNFLVETGVLAKVLVDFPTPKKPTEEDKKVSSFYIHKDVRNKILNNMGYSTEK